MSRAPAMKMASLLQGSSNEGRVLQLHNSKSLVVLVPWQYDMLPWPGEFVSAPGCRHLYELPVPAARSAANHEALLVKKLFTADAGFPRTQMSLKFSKWRSAAAHLAFNRLLTKMIEWPLSRRPKSAPVPPYQPPAELHPSLSTVHVQ